ncbi:Bug family tripartite tricarboxylate transporter substrate binding protein [Roseomonas sp. BN140053]|uniref:Bug family tripartite tricarboxylate transporter substrate binding protein n=1 Tax=Roseomonas sp. BN140053 TaxID=3391898 RepID=UPI0039E89788
MRQLVAAGLAAISLAWSQAALAQPAYPDRPIRMIIPVAPGGAPDIIGRVIGQRLQERMGQPVAVENRSGSNGNIALEVVAKARPDGYTLIVAADSQITVNPALYERMPIDVNKDLLPVASLAGNQFVLSINPSLPARTFQEFIDLAKRSDPPLAFASGGIGSQHQLSMELLMRRAGIRMLHVPYRGGNPAATATVAGEAAATFSGTSSAPLIQQGLLRALATTGPRRSRILPDLPTIGEFYPGYEVTIWQGLFTTAGTPQPVVDRLRREVNELLTEPDVIRRLGDGGGLEPMITTPEQFAELIRSDSEKYANLIREIGLKVE